jgi:hypothetical protein
VCFDSPYRYLRKTFLIIWRIQRDVIINVHRASCTLLVIYRQIFEEYFDIKFHENRCGGSRVVPCEQIDVTKPLVACRSSAHAHKKWVGFVGSFASLVAWWFTYLPRECGGWQSRRRRPSHCTGRKFTQKQTTNTWVELQCGVLCLSDILYEFDLVSIKKISPLNATNCLAKLTCILL